jgi:hypothetical protein
MKEEINCCCNLPLTTVHRLQHDSAARRNYFRDFFTRGPTRIFLCFISSEKSVGPPTVACARVCVCVCVCVCACCRSCAAALRSLAQVPPGHVVRENLLLNEQRFKDSGCVVASIKP